MNETLRELTNRKSVRKYEEREIGAAEKQAILNAAINAPSAGCQQLYSIIDVTDPALKEKLSETCDHQPFIAKAKMVLIFLADCQIWYEGFADTNCGPRSPGAGDLLLAISDAVIAAQNAVTAAESLGIGSCYIGDILENAEEHRVLLGLPEFVVPAAMVVFGYPTEDQKARKKPNRADLDLVVHENRYRRFSKEDRARRLSANRGDVPYESYMQAFCKRKYNSDFSREMTRSCEVYLGSFGMQ
ncbi:MAG: nitroreductase family protein [Clostridia bacterium]|nr:nitroreductase family protein [Clostridia bacterium]